ncbi:hypothetical protein [Cohnella silvisoli]|uniref:Uncharacterized protein n=1 Tax=Cohnella silvisoli TaxID=2873699 RepID=A0ABV1L0F2_9BACL|nr:hypothetical protein [Cohnella silvisoli]MCD9025154.1 hypothetical protein [Cohnella silvisoli]
MHIHQTPIDRRMDLCDNNAAYQGPYTNEIVTQGPGMALMVIYFINGKICM